jgi:hypothetical protein
LASTISVFARERFLQPTFQLLVLLSVFFERQPEHRLELARLCPERRTRSILARMLRQLGLKIRQEQKFLVARLTNSSVTFCLK